MLQIISFLGDNCSRGFGSILATFLTGFHFILGVTVTWSIPEANLCYTKTQRGQDMLVYAGYKYVRNRQSNKNIFWRCSRYVKYGCRATVVTSKDQFNVSIREAGTPHSHDQESKIENLESKQLQVFVWRAHFEWQTIWTEIKIRFFLWKKNFEIIGKCRFFLFIVFCNFWLIQIQATDSGQSGIFQFSSLFVNLLFIQTNFV